MNQRLRIVRFAEIISKCAQYSPWIYRKIKVVFRQFFSVRHEWMLQLQSVEVYTNPYHFCWTSLEHSTSI